MASAPNTAAITASVSELARHGVVPRIAEHLSAGKSNRLQALERTVLNMVPAYTDSANPEILPELHAHLELHLVEITRLLGGALPGDFAFVRQHAQQRARQKFPLEALLHTLRCSHKLLSDWIRNAALLSASTNAHVRRVVAAVADFIIEYTDAVSTVATAAYVDHIRVLAEAEGDQRTELLNTLLRGYDEADPRAAQLLRRSGFLKQRQAYCVVVARSVNAEEMENPARAQRMADALTQALNSTPVRVLVGVRDNLVVVVLSGTQRVSGWTAPQSLLAERVYPHLRTIGPAALIGMSNDVPSTAHIPRAVAQAKLALDHADVAHRVMRYAKISFQQLLVAEARDELQSALPDWVDAFNTANDKSRGALLQTLRAYADNDMNVLRTAKALSIHSNTIYARMQKIRDRTGMDPLSYHALTEMLLVADCTAPAHPA